MLVDTGLTLNVQAECVRAVSPSCPAVTAFMSALLPAKRSAASMAMNKIAMAHASKQVRKSMDVCAPSSASVRIMERTHVSLA